MSLILIFYSLFRNRKTIRSINSKILLIRIFSNLSFLFSNRNISNYNSKQNLLKLFYCQKKICFVLYSKTRSIRENFSTIKMSENSPARVRDASILSKKTKKTSLHINILFLRKTFINSQNKTTITLTKSINIETLNITKSRKNLLTS